MPCLVRTGTSPLWMITLNRSLCSSGFWMGMRKPRWLESCRLRCYMRARRRNKLFVLRSFYCQNLASSCILSRLSYISLYRLGFVRETT
jgi:hypothetical protein